MTAIAHNGVRSFPNNSAIGPYLRIKLTSGFLALAGATDVELGVMEERALATDPVGSVRLQSTHQTMRVVANGAITAGATIYRAASGKVASSGTQAWGIALEAASGDGSIIEALRQI